MRKKPMNPEKGMSAKKTYYQTRGKVHLVHPQSIVDEAKTWCGLGLENMNNQTMEVPECTCQRCLMHMTSPKLKKEEKAGHYKDIRHNMERNARIAERKES